MLMDLGIPFVTIGQVLLPPTDLKTPRLMAERLQQWEAQRQCRRPGEAA
jgi:hypothetical protein